MEQKIKVNGVEYDSPDHMPPDVRKLYDEAMASVGPNTVDPAGSAEVQVKSFGPVHTVVRKSITINGKTYQSVDDLPPEMKELYAKLLAAGQSGQSLPIKTLFKFSVGMLAPQLVVKSVGTRSALDPSKAVPATSRVEGSDADVTMTSRTTMTSTPAPPPLEGAPILGDASGERSLRLALTFLGVVVSAGVALLFIFLTGR